MKLVRIAALAATALAIAAFAGVFQPTGAGAQAAEPERATDSITVNGAGAANVTPDRASFTFGVVSQAGTAAAALNASAQAVDRVVAALRRAGVARNDIATSEVSLSPRTNERGDEIVGYTASNSVTATIRQLGDAGGVVDAAVGAGANQMYGPNLLASDQNGAYREALRAAVADARAKAQTLAAAANVTLGRITTMVETGASPMPLAKDEAAVRSSAPTIEPGTQRIEAMVTVTFETG